MKYWQNKLNTFEQNPECRYHTSNRTKCFIRKCIQREATLCWPPAQIWRPIWRFQFIDVIKCGREGERGFQTKLRHPTMLSQRRGHTPQKSSTPLSSQHERVPAPPTTPTHQPSNVPPPCHLRSPSLAAPALKWVPWSQELLAAGWLRCLSIYRAWPMGIPAIQERVAYIPAGSSGWGRGASSCYTFCESVHMEGKGKQSRPTHLLQLVNTPLLSTLLAIGLHTHTHTHYDPLSYLPDKIHTRPLHQKIPLYSIPPFF